MKKRMRRIISLMVSVVMLFLLMCPVGAEGSGYPVAEGSATTTVTMFDVSYRLIMNKTRLAEHSPTTYLIEGATAMHNYGMSTTISATITDENTVTWTGSSAIPRGYGGGFLTLAAELELTYTETYPTGVTVIYTIPAEWESEYYQIRVGCWHYSVTQTATRIDEDGMVQAYSGSIDYLPMDGGTYFYIYPYHPNEE